MEEVRLCAMLCRNGDTEACQRRDFPAALMTRNTAQLELADAGNYSVEYLANVTGPGSSRRRLATIYDIRLLTGLCPETGKQISEIHSRR